MYDVAVVALYCWILAKFPRFVMGAPISTRSTEGDTGTYIPLIVVSLSIFLVAVLFLVIKLSYMEHRRFRTVRPLHMPRSRSSSFYCSASSLSPQSEKGSKSNLAAAYRPFLVGCFGSPSWEAQVESDLDSAASLQRNKSSFMYRLHRASRTRSSRMACSAMQQNTNSSHITRSMSFFSISSDPSFDDEITTVLKLGCPRMLTYPSERFGHAVRLVPQRRSVSDGPRCFVGDFGEVSRFARGSKSKARYLSKRRSVRLVEPKNSRNACYSFLSDSPPKSPLTSPFTSARDSLQLSRRHSRCSRKPIPPLPPLPSFPLSQPLVNGKNGGLFSTGQYSPPLALSPTTDVAPAFNADRQIVDRIAHKQVSVVLGFSPPMSSIDQTMAFVASKAVETQGNPQDARCFGPCSMSQETPLMYTVQKMNRPPRHKKSRSRTGLILGASPLRSTVSMENVEYESDKENSKFVTLPCTSSVSCHGSSAGTRGSRHSSLARNMTARNQCDPSTESTLGSLRDPTPPSERSTPHLLCTMETSPCDEIPVLTPNSDHIREVDIGMLGLDRFHWGESGEEKKGRSYHTKSDSVALVSFWEDAEWAGERNRTDVGVDY